MVPVATDHSFLKIEMRAGMHFGFIDRVPQNFPADVVLSTNEKSTREAIEVFLANGHSKIAFLVTTQLFIPLKSATTDMPRHFVKPRYL